jgi:hypothetical protein
MLEGVDSPAAVEVGNDDVMTVAAQRGRDIALDSAQAQR